MDQDFGLGSKKNRAFLATRKTAGLVLLVVALCVPVVSSRRSAAPEVDRGWYHTLKSDIARIEAAHAGQLGVFIKDLRTGEALSFRATEPWYVASGVKVPIALEVMRQIESGRISFDTKIRLAESDYVDGAGQTNSHPPGTFLSVRYLMEQMLVHSDNTASDLLIRLVGIDRVNAMVKEQIPSGFYPITTLADVRRLAFGVFHPGAMALKGRDFLVLKSLSEESRKLAALAGILRLGAGQLRAKNLGEAFSEYYETRLNSATLSSYGGLLENLESGKILHDPSSLRELGAIMTRVETGKRRIKAGLPATIAFAHKTGTQHARVCDMGTAWQREAGPKVVIVACVRNFASLIEAEKDLKSVGEAVYKSGVLSAPL
jgi:beta-lactamase class A